MAPSPIASAAAKPSTTALGLGRTGNDVLTRSSQQMKSPYDRTEQIGTGPGTANITMGPAGRYRAGMAVPGQPLYDRALGLRGEIVDGKVHVHAVMAVEGDRAIAGHLHAAEIGTWFARAYVMSCAQ
jgi:hypothetical protein